VLFSLWQNGRRLGDMTLDDTKGTEPFFSGRFAPASGFAFEGMLTQGPVSEAANAPLVHKRYPEPEPSNDGVTTTRVLPDGTTVTTVSAPLREAVGVSHTPVASELLEIHDGSGNVVQTCFLSISVWRPRFGGGFEAPAHWRLMFVQGDRWPSPPGESPGALRGI
jgi:hypothetical protein